MKSAINTAACAAAVLACGMAVFAEATQQPAQSPSQPAAQEPAAAAPSAADAQQEMTTLVGCVQREAEYRQAKSEGAGGVAGTGAGVANEFVLVNAAPASATTAEAATPAAPGAKAGEEAVGTSGSTGIAYELTGAGEGQLQQYVGRRVEVIGRAKTESSAGARPGVSTGSTGSSTTGAATGAPAGATTGSASGRPAQPTGGVDLMGQDLNLKEFEVVSVRESTGACPSNQR